MPRAFATAESTTAGLRSARAHTSTSDDAGDGYTPFAD
jgi:hypothetical protein